MKPVWKHMVLFVADGLAWGAIAGTTAVVVFWLLVKP